MLGPNSRQRAISRNPDTARGKKEPCAKECHRSTRDRSLPKTGLPLASGCGFREGSHHPNDRRAHCASAACSVTGFKLNACFPSGSLARACAEQRGYAVTPLLGHTERGLWTRHLVSTLPRCLSFVGCGQCPFSVINHSHENNHMLSPRESANLG